MSEAVRQQAQVAGQPFRVADWRVDPASGSISRGGRAFKLEPRVMDVLVYLAARPGRVVSREEPEAAVWTGRVVGYDALTGTVQKLRRAFADDVRQPCVIETISKRGYRLVAPVAPVEQVNRQDQAPSAGIRGDTRGQRIRSGRLLLAVMVVAAIAGLLWPGPGTITLDRAREGVAPPSIAVLPFDSLSDDPAGDYFADGVTDDLITELAKNPALLVISRDSSFVYRGRPADLRDVARRLGVHYVLRGSVRRAGDRVLLNAQLVDARTGHHLWAEHYDSELRQVFALQDEIARNVFFVLASATRAPESPDAGTARSRSPEAYDYFLHGRNRFFLYASKRDNQQAREFYQKAIELDQDFAVAYAMLAWTYAFEAMNGWSEVREESLQQAQQLAEHAITLDAALPVAYFVTGLVYRERGEYMKALVEAEKAISLDPNYANAHVLLATLPYYAGRPEEGLERIRRAIQLNPHHPYNYPFHLGQAYFILRRYPEVIEAFEQGLASKPASERMRVWLVAAYAQAGRDEDAGWEVEQVLANNPEFSLERIRQAFPFKDPEDLEHLLDGLRKAGFTRN